MPSRNCAGSAVALARTPAPASRVRAQRVVGHDRLRDEIRPLRLHARRRRAARSSCTASRRSRRPSPRSCSRARDRCRARRARSPPSTARRSPAPTPARSGLRRPDAKIAMLPGLRIDFPDRRAALLPCRCRSPPTLLFEPTVDVELRAVGAGDEVLRPVMVDRAGRQIHDLRRRRGDLRRARLVGEARPPRRSSPHRSRCRRAPCRTANCRPSMNTRARLGNAVAIAHRAAA